MSYDQLVNNYSDLNLMNFKYSKCNGNGKSNGNFPHEKIL